MAEGRWSGGRSLSFLHPVHPVKISFFSADLYRAASSVTDPQVSRLANIPIISAVSCWK